MKVSRIGWRFVSGFGLFVALGCLQCSDGDGTGFSDGTSGESSGGEGGDAGRGGGGVTAGYGGAAAGAGGDSGGAAGTPGASGGGAGPGSPDETAGAGGVAGQAGDGAGGAPGGAAGTPSDERARHGYVFSRLLMPTNNSEATSIGFDLNGDDVVDNKFGRAMAQLASMGFPINPSIKKAIDDGRTIMLSSLDTTSLADASEAGFLTYFGSNPLPQPCSAPLDCGHHLEGTGRFSIAQDNQAGQVSLGAVHGGVFRGRGGALPIKLVLGAEPIQITLENAQVELSDLTAEGFPLGRIGGSISEEMVGNNIFPAVHHMVVAAVANACTGGPPPTCGCAVNSNALVLLGAFDANHDCSVALDEVKGNTAMKALFAPDLDTKDADQVPDALSCAFAIRGVRAEFDVP